MNRSYWIVQADPNVTAAAVPDHYWVDADPDMNVGDIIYLWFRDSDYIFGWGEVADPPSKKRNFELGREQYDLVVKPRDIHGVPIRPLHISQKVAAANAPTSMNNPAGWTPVKLTAEEAVDINNLFLQKGRRSPPGPNAIPQVDATDQVGTEPLLRFDVRRADAEYKPFPPFTEWAGLHLDITRWDRYASRLKEKGATSTETLKRALNVVKRAAAVDTGAIEGLYQTDRGFTFSVAMEVAAWETLLSGKGPEVASLFKSQLEAYDYILDFATRRVPIAEAWIRELHAVICAAQEVYTAYTPFGIQKQTLVKGEYKTQSNHVISREGEIHSYAPVDLTPAEMHRLCEELVSNAFLAAHPVLQASYSHYALVCVHPFADGNGRVARALASVFTYRSQSVPILILSENNREYYDALASADEGDPQPFVDFMLERTLDAIQVASDSLRSVQAPALQDSLAGLHRLHRTRGGYTHAEVDQAGLKLLNLLGAEISRVFDAEKKGDEIVLSLGVDAGQYNPLLASSRLPSSGAQRLYIKLSSIAPAEAVLERSFGIEVPKDCGREDDLIIQDVNTKEIFEARITAVHPNPSGALSMRLRILAERILSEGLNDLRVKAAESLRKNGLETG
jgi:Fic family protein